ncbi:MAG TPA: hypothetical protein VLA02_17840 [Reyranella sp.]|nr:hypothetical protein [Reyranella sp.]
MRGSPPGAVALAPQAGASRLTDVRHTTRIDGIAMALRALGKRLDLRTV